MRPKLRLLPPLPPQPEPPDYPEIYSRIIREHCESVDEFSTNVDRAKQLVYWGIKGALVIFKDDIDGGSGKPFPSKELVDGVWAMTQATQRLISTLTPRQFMNIFPIEKRYNGDRYEVKDYFSTMEELEEIGMDTPIGEHTESLLFDYQNPHVFKFNMFKFKVLDRIRAYQGLPSVMEAFLAEQGVYPLTLMTDENGKQFVYDGAKQTCYPVVKKRPRYLRVVK